MNNRYDGSRSNPPSHSGALLQLIVLGFVIVVAGLVVMGVVEQCGRVLEVLPKE